MAGDLMDKLGKGFKDAVTTCISRLKKSIVGMIESVSGGEVGQLKPIPTPKPNKAKVGQQDKTHEQQHQSGGGMGT